MKKLVSIKIHQILQCVYDGLMNFSETTFPKLIDSTIGRLMDKIGKPYMDEINEAWSIDLEIKNFSNG